MIKIVQYHKWNESDFSSLVTGTFTSIIDTYLNLKKFVDVELVIISEQKNPISRIKFFQKNSYFGDKKMMNSFTNNPVVDSDIIICSARLLTEYAACIQLKAKKLIVLDSLDLARRRYGVHDSLPQITLSQERHDFNIKVDVDECIFLVNPSNFGSTKFKEIEWYHKFSKKRLDSLYFYSTSLNYCRKDKKIFHHKRFIYFYDGKYYENIGKRIFEYLYGGMIVNYSPEGMFTRDGLWYYLKLFDVDASKFHKPLRISKSNIIKKLFMNENDILLEML